MKVSDYPQIGKRYKNTRLRVIKEIAHIHKGIKTKLLLTKCECGKQKVVRKYDLMNGKTKSCGCYKQELGNLYKQKIALEKKINALRNNPSKFSKPS